LQHSAKECVRGDVRPNSIEGAAFKRGVGSFHQNSHKHLARYLKDFEFRRDNRKNPYLFRDPIARPVQAEFLPTRRLPRWLNP
jgi:hypothetical protein